MSEKIKHSELPVKPNFEAWIKRAAFKAHPLDIEPSVITTQSAEDICEEIWNDFLLAIKEGDELKAENTTLKNQLLENDLYIKRLLLANGEIEKLRGEVQSRDITIHNYKENFNLFLGKMQDNEKLREALAGVMEDSCRIHDDSYMLVFSEKQMNEISSLLNSK